MVEPTRANDRELQGLRTVGSSLLRWGLLVAALHCGATAATGQTYFGAGHSRCSDYVREVTSRGALQYNMQGWVLGYVSGLNMIWKTVRGSDPLLTMEPTQALSYTLRYCQNNPENTLANAANAFFFSLPM
jgi:hypothetical protein